MPECIPVFLIRPRHPALSLSDTIDLICVEVSTINANLEALLADLRRERAQEAKQAKEVNE